MIDPNLIPSWDQHFPNNGPFHHPPAHRNIHPPLPFPELEVQLSSYKITTNYITPTSVKVTVTGTLKYSSVVPISGNINLVATTPTSLISDLKIFGNSGPTVKVVLNPNTETHFSISEIYSFPTSETKEFMVYLKFVPAYPLPHIPVPLLVKRVSVEKSPITDENNSNVKTTAVNSEKTQNKKNVTHVIIGILAGLGLLYLVTRR